MFVFLIDEESAHNEIKDILIKADPDVEIMSFTSCDEALDAVSLGIRPDVVLSEIVLQGMSGLEFAESLRVHSPQTQIIFITAHSEYAIDAFRVKANGYLLKPVTEEDIRRELSYVPAYIQAPHDRLEIHCFGFFDVYWQGSPLVFSRKKSKELLAYLIDRNGAACTSGEIGLALWEDEGDDQAEKNRVRVVINDLKNTLKSIGMEDALLRAKREIAIKKDFVDCDYYRLLSGDTDARNSFQGEYMKQYGWAELTNARLHFITEEEPEYEDASIVYM